MAQGLRARQLAAWNTAPSADLRGGPECMNPAAMPDAMAFWNRHGHH